MTDSRQELVEIIARATAKRQAEVRVDGKPLAWELFGDYAECILSALRERGWVVVPREPTPEMICAGDDSGMWGPGVAIHENEHDADPKRCWAAMISIVTNKESENE